MRQPIRQIGLVLIAMTGFCSASIFAQDRSPKLAESQIKDTEGLVLVSWDQADRYAEHTAVVYGPVVRVAPTKERCFINFSENWQTTFSISIKNEFLKDFSAPPEELYKGKTIAAWGYLDAEGGRPEMAIRSPDQIVVVPDENKADVFSYLAPKFSGLRRAEDVATVHRSETPTTIRIGTYNVLSLFDEYDDPYHADEVMNTKPRAELEKLAQRIRQLDADVLTLVEVENRHYLEKFVRVLLPDMGYDHCVLIEGNNHRGIDVALLSRFPIGPVTTHAFMEFKGPDEKTYRFQRDFLQVRVLGPQGFDFDVFCVHLKSKYGGAEASEPIRQAETGEARKILDEILTANPKAPFVICGDFNDLWDSPSLKILRGSGETELTTPLTDLPPDQQISYNQEPHRSLIDFIVCSPEMRKHYVKDSCRIIPGSVDDSGSDHNPAVAAFQITLP